MVLVAVTYTAEERDGCSGVSKVVVASGIDAGGRRRYTLYDKKIILVLWNQFCRTMGLKERERGTNFVYLFIGKVQSSHRLILQLYLQGLNEK